jgi:hydroxymethylbilane synthase
MAQSSRLRIGTRGSPLAMVQARAVRERLAAANAIAADDIELVVIRTSGDIIADRPLAEEGGKGLFTKEIEESLLAGAIDLAVHSAKDLPGFLPDKLLVAGCLKREDARDVFISAKAPSLRELPQGATVATTSPRRQALVLRVRPDIKVVPMRGNVETRLQKMQDGAADATILALAGLKRLGLADKATAIMDVGDFLPAVGQGAITIEARADDAETRALIGKVDDADTSAALLAERSFLAELEGTCRTPIAGHATIDGDRLSFRGLIATPNGRIVHDVQREGSRRAARDLGCDAGRELKRRGGPRFFD